MAAQLDLDELDLNGRQATALSELVASGALAALARDVRRDIFNRWATTSGQPEDREKLYAELQGFARFEHKVNAKAARKSAA